MSDPLPPSYEMVSGKDQQQQQPPQQMQQQPVAPPQAVAYQPQPQMGYAQPGMPIQQQPMMGGWNTQMGGQQQNLMLRHQGMMMRMLPMKLGKVPVTMACPNCGSQVLTETRLTTGSCAWIIAILLCSFLLFFVAWIPLVMDSCKDTVHSCPECRGYVGFDRDCTPGF